MKRRRRGFAPCSIEGEEQEVEVGENTYVVTYNATGEAIYRPAQLYGPPENCYPDESECDICEIKITLIADIDGSEIKGETFEKACLAALDTDKITDQLWDAFMEQDDDRA